MPALDKCQQQVVNALQKEGWQLLKSPYNVFTIYRTIYIDIAMSKGQNGTQQQIIVIEIKCFPDPNSTTRDVYTSIGQYLIYRVMLESMEMANNLYLAVPDAIFNAVFDEAVMKVVKADRIKMVIVDLDAEAVTRWIHW